MASTSGGSELARTSLITTRGKRGEAGSVRPGEPCSAELARQNSEAAPGGGTSSVFGTSEKPWRQIGCHESSYSASKMGSNNGPSIRMVSSLEPSALENSPATGHVVP